MTVQRSRRPLVMAGVAVVLVSSALPSPGWAQFSPVQGREYREVLNPVNPVRGEAVVGVSVVPHQEASRSQTVEVWLPEGLDGELVLETLTADGRFRGEGAYRGKSDGGRWVALPLKGKSTLNVRPGDPYTLAVAVRGPRPTLLVARWGPTTPQATPAPQQTSSIRLYVNGRRGDMFVSAGGNVVPCTPVKIPQPLRFDAYCDVPASAVRTDGRVILTRRDQFDEQTQTVMVDARGIP